MFLLVDFSSRHIFPTANWVGESCERGFPWQISGTVPAVSPKGTSAHPFSILQRRHYTFFTHFTVHDEAYFIYRVHIFICLTGLVEHAESTKILHVVYVSRITQYIHICTNISLVVSLCFWQDFDTRFCLFYRVEEIEFRFIW